MKNLKYLRVIKNITQRQLALSLNCKQANISKYETGLTQPRIEQIPKLAESLNCSIEDVVIALINTQKEGVGNGKRN